MTGISKLSLRDVKIAERAGYRIKLLGRAVRMPGGGRTAYVAPHLIPEDHPLANVEDVFNAIQVTGNAIGDAMFYGRGAGKLPTASAVVGDVIDAAKHLHDKKYLDWGPGDPDMMVSPDVLVSRFYVRAERTADAVRTAFGETELLTRADAPENEAAFLTAPMTRPQLEEKLSSLKSLSVIRVLA